MVRKLVVYIVVLMTILAGGVYAENSRVVVDAGMLKLDVTVSETATLFHVVDQISNWSEFCHRQYIRYFDNLNGGLNDEDRELLKQHAAIRSKYGWGGLEPVFYTMDDLDIALNMAVKKKIISEQEAQTEKKVLLHFKPRVDQLTLQEEKTLTQFRDKLIAKISDLKDFTEKMSSFIGKATLDIPFYMIANPDGNSIGGGYNGGRLTLEISGTRDAYPTLLHEVFHALINTKENVLKDAARPSDGLDEETLSEGLAYALSPGIIGDTNSDQLLSEVIAYNKNGASLKDSYARFNSYGLALRPLLKDAFYNQHQTLEVFLPRAVDAWLVLSELDKAKTNQSGQAVDYKKDPKHSIFVFGSFDDESFQALYKAANRHLFGRPHKAEMYKDMLTRNSKPGDTIILLLSLDSSERVPAEFSDLLPQPWPDVESKLKQGQMVNEQGKAREMSVFLIATPTHDQMLKEFKRMVAEKKL